MQARMDEHDNPKISDTPTDASTMMKDIDLRAIPFSLARSSYCPGSRNRSDIQNSLKRSENTISDLEDEISNLQSRLLHTRKFAAFQSSLLAPIRRLHDELLCEIFSCLCKEAINISVGSGPIWDLRQVCARWRFLVDNNATLWSRFKVKRMKLSPTMITRRVQLCLENSRESPLSVSLVPYRRRKLPNEVFANVMHHASRLLTLYIHADIILTAPESGTVYHRLPSLKKLTIEISSNCESKQPYMIPSLLTVMRCRARSASSDTTQDGYQPTSLVPSPLSVIHFIGSTSRDAARKYFSALKDVKELGRHLGIDVITRLETVVSIKGRPDRCMVVILDEDDVDKEVKEDECSETEESERDIFAVGELEEEDHLMDSDY